MAGLSPRRDRHVNFLGRYRFSSGDEEPGEGLRPLRDPDAPQDADDDDLE